MKNKSYSSAFLVSILAFVEGVLFTIFTWELFQEQLESLEDNQTYIDDMQKLWGRQQDFFVNCELFFGNDKWYWLIPTHPCLKINYLERLYTRIQLKQMIRAGTDCDEEEWDLNKKHYINELRKSNFEKRVLLFLIIGFGIFWYFYLQEYLVGDPFWGSNATKEQLTKYLGRQI